MALLLAGCATAPTKYKSVTLNQGAWSGKARIENLKDQSSHTLSLDFVAQKDHNLRMDVTTPLGIYLASLIVHNNHVEYLLPRQRKFFAGPVSDHALRPVLGINLNPLLLQNLLFDTEPDPNEFTCRKDSFQFLSQCVSENGQITVRWQKRRGDGSRTIEIDAPRASITLFLSSARSNVQVTEKTFRLTVPEGFRSYRLN